MHTDPRSWLIALNRANGEAEVAAAVIQVDKVRIEVQVPREARVAREERRRPVGAVLLIVEARIVPLAGGRQENGIAVGCSK